MILTDLDRESNLISYSFYGQGVFRYGLHMPGGKK